jgi:hypothetical protein
MTTAADATVQWLVLAAPTDPCGPWVRDGLRARGFDGVRAVSVDALVYSTSITHRVTTAATSTEIVLHDGTVVGPGLRGTVNRVGYLPARHLDRAAPVDRDYAIQELYALFTSILHGLPGRTVNPAGSRGLSGPFLRPVEWAVAAGAAGLTVAPRRSLAIEQPVAADGRLVFCVGPAVVGASGAAVPDAVADGCRRLAVDTGVDLLALTFELDGEQWLFRDASCDVDIRPGGAPLLDALAEVLR